MGKFVDNSVIDSALTKISTGTVLIVCSSQPTTFTEATVTYSLASSSPLTSGSFTIANGDLSGRKVTISQQNAIPITVSGTATHIAVCDSSTVLLVTTCTSQVLTSGGTVTVPVFKDEIASPI